MINLNKKIRKTLFSEVVKEWLTTMKYNIEKSTYLGYESIVKNIIIPYFEKKKIYIEDITTSDLQKFYFSELDRGINVSTLKKRHIIIKPVLDYAIYVLKLRIDNPAIYIKFPKSKKFMHEILEPETLKFLLEKEKNNQIEMGIFLGGIYGLRRSEIIGLKWSSIDLVKNIFLVKDTVLRIKINGKLQIIERNYGKTDSSYRNFPIIPEFKNLLIRIKAKQDEDLKKKCYKKKYLEYIYRDGFGELVKPGYLSRKFKQILSKYNVKEVRFHDLRHTCATFLYQMGIPMKDIQNWLGHSSISTTMNIYTHLNFENKKLIGEKIDLLFKK